MRVSLLLEWFEETLQLEKRLEHTSQFEEIYMYAHEQDKKKWVGY